MIFSNHAGIIQQWLTLSTIFYHKTTFFLLVESLAKHTPNNTTIYTAKTVPKLQNLLDFCKIFDTI